MRGEGLWVKEIAALPAERLKLHPYWVGPINVYPNAQAEKDNFPLV